MTRIAHELKYNLVFWSVVDGLVDTQKGTNNSANAQCLWTEALPLHEIGRLEVTRAIPDPNLAPRSSCRQKVR
jgi:hypothetical protein